MMSAHLRTSALFRACGTIAGIVALILISSVPLSGEETGSKGAIASDNEGLSQPDGQSALPTRASAVFAGGCFWCMESDFERAPGVIDIISGYSGGRTKGPTYETYAAGGHREVIFVIYDPTVVTFGGLVEYLIKHIDPINRKGQFNDRGLQYAPAIYYANEQEKAEAEKVIAAVEERKVFRGKLNVAVQKRQAFWPAEDHHQNYHEKNVAKYEFYRLNSGRDAFVERHWGASANLLELPGAFPDQSPAANPTVAGVGHSAPLAVISPANSGASTGDARLESPQKLEPWKKFKKPTIEQLQEKLTPLQFRVTQHDDTEPAYRNAYWDNHRPGIYVEVVSGAPLFASSAKFESGTGWPSFFQPIEPDAVVYKPDFHLLYQRIEVRSRYGDSHLGHVFDDGPIAFGGKRFCMNSAALRFIPKDQMEAEGYGAYLSKVEPPPAH